MSNIAPIPTQIIDYIVNNLIEARDDAKNVHSTRILDILNGIYPMAFGHVRFLKQALFQSPNIISKPEFKEWEEKIDCLIDLSTIRNTLIAICVNELYVRPHNSIIESRNSTLNEENEENISKKAKLNEDFEMYSDNLLFEVPVNEEMDKVFRERDFVIEKAIKLGIDYSSYLKYDFNIEKDIEECFNSHWNHDQKTEIQKTADSIIIITDIDGQDYVLTITRMFGPGNGCVAFQGGLVDENESFEEAGERENEEETGMNIITFPHEIKRLVKDLKINDRENVIFQKITINSEIHGAEWDPRVKFARFGTENGAICYHIFL